MRRPGALGARVGGVPRSPKTRAPHAAVQSNGDESPGFFCGFALLFSFTPRAVVRGFGMFRFAEAPVLHDETSWSAWGTRRRRPARPPSGSLVQHAAERTEHRWSCSPQPSTDAPRELRQLHTTVRVPRGEKEQSLRAGAGPGSPGSTSTRTASPRPAATAPAPVKRAPHAPNSWARTPAAALPKNAQNRPEEGSRP